MPPQPGKSFFHKLWVEIALWVGGIFVTGFVVGFIAGAVIF